MSLIAGRYAKFITALLGQALVFAQVEWGGQNRWVQAATAGAVALGVLAVPNTGQTLRMQVAAAPPDTVMTAQQRADFEQWVAAGKPLVVLGANPLVSATLSPAPATGTTGVAAQQPATGSGPVTPQGGQAT